MTDRDCSLFHRFQLCVWPLPHHVFPKISPLLKIVVKFQSEALHGGWCVSLSYRNRCFHTEQPGCLMGCFKGHCFSVIRGGSPDIHHAGPASTMQEPRCSGATDSPLSDQLELQNCGFSFDLRTKETGFFFYWDNLESLIIGI